MDKYRQKGKDADEKIAIVCCETVAEVCPGGACCKAFNKSKFHFRKYSADTEIIGFFTCGGCPGKRVPRLVDRLVKQGLTAVPLSTCMVQEKDSPFAPTGKK
jgi:predicted metal-binding protein